MGAFIPTKPLAPSTLYTVTIKAGLPLPGTEQVLERDRRIQFETVNKAASKLDWMTVPARLVDTATKEQPTVVLNFYDRNNDDKTTVPPRLPITVHRVATLPAAMADYERLLAAPDWAPSGGAPIDTSGLTQVVAATVRVRSVSGEDGSAYLQLPSALPGGWYVLTIVQGDVRQQVLLQVTDLASYAMVTETRTVAWVNSLATGQPVVGATVEVAGDSHRSDRGGRDAHRRDAGRDAHRLHGRSAPLHGRPRLRRSLDVRATRHLGCLRQMRLWRPGGLHRARRVVARARRRAQHVALDRPCQRLGRRPRS